MLTAVVLVIAAGVAVLVAWGLNLLGETPSSPTPQNDPGYWLDKPAAELEAVLAKTPRNEPDFGVDSMSVHEAIETALQRRRAIEAKALQDQRMARYMNDRADEKPNEIVLKDPEP